MTSDYIEHLKMIQQVITRMADNSFKYKGWCITLVSALLALAAKDQQPGYALIGLIPAVFFWWLDAYYLRQERLFRRLFDGVRRRGQAAAPPVGEPPADFSMQTSPPPCTDSESRKYTLVGAGFSGTIFWLYVPLVLVVIVVGVILWIITQMGRGH